MAEKVNIASLTINVDDVIKESVRLQKEIDKIKESQKGLDRTTDDGIAAYAKYDAQLKNLTKSYRDNQQFASALEAANEDLNKTLEVEGKSTQELRDSRSQLNKISKNIVGNTEEEITLRDKLNKAIDEQTEALRGQSSEFNTDKDRVGEYKKSILEAVAELMRQKSTLEETRQELIANQKLLKSGSEEYKNNALVLASVNKEIKKVNESIEDMGDSSDSVEDVDLSLQGLIKSSSSAGGAMGYIKKGLTAAKDGMIAFTKATLSFLATPIGVIIVALAAAFALVKSAMDRSEDSTNKIKTAFSAFSGILKGFFAILQPIGDFLINTLVAGLELVEKGLYGSMNVLQKGLKALGFDSAAASLGNFTKEIETSATASKELTKAEQDLEKQQRAARKTQLEYQNAAEKLRQIRDDESKSMAQRIKANEELGAVLKKQSKDELAIANKALDVANKKIKLEGQTKEALDERANAELEIVDIQERITGQVSEQLVNRVSLQKEAAEKIVALHQSELDAFLAANSTKTMTLQEEVDFEREAAKKKVEILNEELASKLITQQQYNADVITIQNELLKKQAEATADNARRELDEYIAANKAKIDDDKYKTDEQIAAEKARLDGIAQAKRDYEKVRLEEDLVTQQDYNTAINEINEENRIANEELAKERQEAEKERLAIDAQNKLDLLTESNNNELQNQAAQLEAERLQEVAVAEKTGADTTLINKKYAAKQKKIEDENNKNRLSSYAEMFGGISELLGENTAAGKAAAIAQATINTYQGVTEVWKAPSVLPEPFNTATKIVATGTTLISGLSAVRKIASTSTEFGEGDILTGKSHAAGGIPFSVGGALGFEAEGGEAIINKRSTSMFAPLLSAINVAGGGKKFAYGGISGTNSGVPSPASLIDYDLLATKIAAANSSLPNPVVSVEEINRVSKNVSVIENIATL